LNSGLSGPDVLLHITVLTVTRVDCWTAWT